MKDSIGDIKGHIKMVFTNKETGEVVDYFEDKNLFINLGRSNVMRAISTLTTDDYVVESLRFGEDFGDPGAYDIFNPEPAQLDFDSTTMTEVFSITRPTLNISYPTFNSVQFACILDGSAILDLFPGSVDVRYTSVGLYNGVDDPIAYRRFPVKSINRLLSISVTWDLLFV